VITIARSDVDAVRAADGPVDLYPSLQNALQLEHSTIPLYLTAYFSLRNVAANTAVAETLRSIVVEEMLHFTIVANVLNALGGAPLIDDEAMVPTYPGSLPLPVEAGLLVSAQRMSPEQAAVFLQIEEPEDPVGLPPGDPDVTTIGEFYRALIDRIGGFGDAAFGSPSAPSVLSSWYAPGRLFPVDSVSSAVRALEGVVEQGEGTATRPTAGEGDPELAHYYRFGEIVHGKRFVPDADAPEGFSYTGDGVAFDASAVYPLFPDAKLALYAGFPAARGLAVRFCTAYRQLLTCLQKTFSGSPDALADAFGLMYALRIAALAMMAVPDPEPTRAGFCLSPTWQYLA
jgi:Ferritin-like